MTYGFLGFLINGESTNGAVQSKFTVDESTRDRHSILNESLLGLPQLNVTYDLS
jgi:hypothetical protein